MRVANSCVCLAFVCCVVAVLLTFLFWDYEYIPRRIRLDHPGQLTLLNVDRWQWWSSHNNHSMCLCPTHLVSTFPTTIKSFPFVNTIIPMGSLEIFTFEEVKSQLEPIIIENERVRKHKYVLPGDTITKDASFMRGLGTYYDDLIEDLDTGGDGSNNNAQPERKLISSLAGIVEPTNRLISVRPLRTRYNGAIGDVVVGRIIEVQQKRWRVETSSRMDSVLLLSSVNLPGGELRRKTVEDELLMKEYLCEGDLICAEVQTIYEDGALGLYTRNLKYGKLGQGVIIRVSPSMIAKRKLHCHNLPAGVYIIFGNNGWIFISSTSAAANNSGGFIIDKGEIPFDLREQIARVRNCILALSDNKIILDYTSIVTAVDISEKLEFEVKDLLKPNVMRMVADQTRIDLINANLVQV